jgi:hypothetical protein
VKKLLIILILFGVSAHTIYAQNKTIKGRVISEEFEANPGTLIRINDTVKVGETDFDGFFKIDIPVSVKKISFYFVASEPTTISLLNDCDQVEVVMMSIRSPDFITLKKQNSLRFKSFKKLPKIHIQAFEKGLFQTDKACYTQEFVP